jgi:hypothetical protein
VLREAIVMGLEGEDGKMGVSTLQRIDHLIDHHLIWIIKSMSMDA